MDALRKQRGTVKTKVTKLERKIDTERNSGQQISAERIEVRKIVGMQVGEPSVTEATEDEDFEDKYLNLKTLLKEMLASVAAMQAETRSSPNDEVLAHVLQQRTEIMRL